MFLLTLTLVRQLYVHMEWADAAVWAAMPPADNAPPDRRLRDLAFHLHLTQRAFLEMWYGRRVVPPDPAGFSTLTELRDWARPYYRDVTSFLEALGAARLDDAFEVPWSRRYEERLGRPIAPATIGDTILQVPSHSTYHRGQLNSRLRELGVTPPLVDYIAWVWAGRPDPVWVPEG